MPSNRRLQSPPGRTGSLARGSYNFRRRSLRRSRCEHGGVGFFRIDALPYQTVIPLFQIRKLELIIKRDAQRTDIPPYLGVGGGLETTAREKKSYFFLTWLSNSKTERASCTPRNLRSPGEDGTPRLQADKLDLQTYLSRPVQSSQDEFTA